MNSALTLSAWLQWLGMVALELVVVVGCTALLQRCIRSVLWHRTLWQGCTLTLLAVGIIELTAPVAWTRDAGAG